MKCLICKEHEAVFNKRCNDCKDSLSISGARTTKKKNTVVSICEKGHKHIPFKGKCQFCTTTSPRFQTTEVEESTFTKTRYIEL